MTMDAKSLLRQFKADPGAAFVGIIRAADKSATLGSVRALLVEAGATKAEVNARWKSAQPFLAEHPHVRHPPSTQLYVWSDEPVRADVALASLTKRRQIPEWLRQALADTVAAGLGATDDGSGDSPSGQRRPFERAKALAEVIVYVEELVHGGASADEVADWLRHQAAENSLELVGRVGQTIGYDPREQVAVTGSPQVRTKVMVVRPGAVWTGGEAPVLVSRTLVRPNA
jgi:hypothetical protein